MALWMLYCFGFVPGPEYTRWMLQRQPQTCLLLLSGYPTPCNRFHRPLITQYDEAEDFSANETMVTLYKAGHSVHSAQGTQNSTKRQMPNSDRTTWAIWP